MGVLDWEFLRNILIQKFRLHLYIAHPILPWMYLQTRLTVLGHMVCSHNYIWVLTARQTKSLHGLQRTRRPSRECTERLKAEKKYRHEGRVHRGRWSLSQQYLTIE